MPSVARNKSPNKLWKSKATICWKSIHEFDSLKKEDITSQKSRVEYRSYRVLNAVVLPDTIRNDWSTIKTIVMTDSYRILKEKKVSI